MKKIIASVTALVLFLASFTVCVSASDKKSDEWKAMVKENYDEFIAEVDGDSSKIPMIVSTDQHGAVKASSEIFKYLDEIVDWSKISKVLSLGDTVKLIYNPFELISYRLGTRYIPQEKRIELCGNHDGHILPFRIFTRIFFKTPGAVESEKKDAFVVKDEDFNVRYLSIDPMSFPWSYTGGTLSSEQADFFVEELSKEDNSDIILISHPYLFRDAITRRSGSTFTGSDYFIGSEEKYGYVKQSFVDMLLARRNKTAGVLIDCEGREHPYDFTRSEGDFLMSLHGHHHAEGYETKDGVTEFLFQSLRYDNAQNTEPDCFYFAYIDRDAKTFKCWKNIEGYDAWEISIA